MTSIFFFFSKEGQDNSYRRNMIIKFISLFKKIQMYSGQQFFQMMIPYLHKPTETGNLDSVTDDKYSFTPYPYVFSCPWKRERGVKGHFLCIFPHSGLYLATTNQWISWLFSPLPFLPPYTLSFCLEPGWLTVNIDQTLSLSYSKHTRTSPTQNRAWGL